MVNLTRSSLGNTAPSSIATSSAFFRQLRKTYKEREKGKEGGRRGREGGREGGRGVSRAASEEVRR